MKYCKGHRTELEDTQFNGNYNYCNECHINYKSRRNNKNFKNKQNTIVYFIQCGNLIKIGYTSNLEERKSNLQVANPDPLIVLKTIDGGYIEEQKLHEKFSHLKKQGEWFHATKELIDYIDSQSIFEPSIKN